MRVLVIRLTISEAVFFVVVGASDASQRVLRGGDELFDGSGPTHGTAAVRADGRGRRRGSWTRGGAASVGNPVARSATAPSVPVRQQHSLQHGFAAPRFLVSQPRAGAGLHRFAHARRRRLHQPLLQRFLRDGVGAGLWASPEAAWFRRRGHPGRPLRRLTLARRSSREPLAVPPHLGQLPSSGPAHGALGER